MTGKRLAKSYFKEHNAIYIAENLLGKTLIRRFDDGRVARNIILETEAYLGSEDLGNHASKGRTKRTETMFSAGGILYMYLIYGVHWMLNIVTGEKDHPEAVLIRGIENYIGPGRVGKYLELNKSFLNEDLETSSRIWIEDDGIKGKIIRSPRVGIDYAGDYWKNKPWRFQLLLD